MLNIYLSIDLVKEKRLLSIANLGSNTNFLQIFVTFASSPRLSELHTVFGGDIKRQDVIEDVEAADTEENGVLKAAINILCLGASTDTKIKNDIELDSIQSGIFMIKLQTELHILYLPTDKESKA